MKARHECKLCGRNGDLRQSHILPEFLYKVSYDAKHRLVVASTGENEFVRIEQRGLREELLCQGCETRLSAWERYAHQVMFRTDSFSVADEPKRLVIHGIDYGRFKLFQHSILWRASVASGDMFRGVSLGPHQERLRGALLRGDPGDPYDYPCIFLTVPEMPAILDRAITSPEHYRFQGCHAYRFTLGRMFASFVVSNRAKDVVVPAAILSRAGELPVLKDVDGATLPLIRHMFARLASSEKLRTATENTEQAHSGDA